jgi:hypothetical protein
MTWQAPKKTCTSCGVCFGDYGSDCSWPGGCDANGELRGWKPRTEAGIERQRQKELHRTSGSTGQAQEPSPKPPEK